MANETIVWDNNRFQLAAKIAALEAGDIAAHEQITQLQDRLAILVQDHAHLARVVYDQALALQRLQMPFWKRWFNVS